MSQPKPIHTIGADSITDAPADIFSWLRCRSLDPHDVPPLVSCTMRLSAPVKGTSSSNEENPPLGTEMLFNDGHELQGKLVTWPSGSKIVVKGQWTRESKHLLESGTWIHEKDISGAYTLEGEYSVGGHIFEWATDGKGAKYLINHYEDGARDLSGLWQRVEEYRNGTVRNPPSRAD